MEGAPAETGKLATILLLDDDAHFRRALIPELEARGLAVVEAQRAKDADLLLARGGIDLVVVDGLLPDDSGVEWIARLRASGRTLPVVFCSAFYRDLDTFKRLTDELGVTTVRRKPIEAETLAEELVAWVPRSARTNARRRRRSSADAILFLVDEEPELDGICPAVPTVLVADDDPALVSYLASVAHDQLLNLVGATDLEAALEAHHRHRPAVAIVGVPFGEPDESGPLLAELRARDPGLPFGAFTLDGDFASRRAAAALGARRVLHHPIEAVQFARIAWELETSRCTSPLRVVIVCTADPDCSLEGALRAAGADVERVADFDALFEVLRADAVVVAGGHRDTELCAMVRASEVCGDAALVVRAPRRAREALLAGADHCFAGSERDVAGVVLALAERVCRRRRAAHVDTLTGLPRRPAIARALSSRLATAHRQGLPFTLAILDVQGLKAVNRDHGRLAGDRALAHVGRMLAARLRGGDLLGRWSGDRFLIGFSSPDASAPARVCDRIAAELADRPASVGGAQVSLGFHRGLAHYPQHGDGLRDLLGHAHADLEGRRTSARSG